MNTNIKNNNIRGSSVMYQSFSYNMIKDILSNTSVQAWIRIWIYFSLLQKYGNTIYAKNNYISKKLNIPLGTVKYSITKLKDEGLIEIVNSGSWLRQIKLTKVAIIDEDANKDIKDNNEREYHAIYNRTLYKDYVYLSDNEYTALMDLIQDEKVLEEYIDGINLYLSNALIKYSSHYELILIWYKNNQEQIKKKKKKFDTPNYIWFKEVERGYLKDAKTNKTDDDIFWYDWLNDDTDDEE